MGSVYWVNIWGQCIGSVYRVSVWVNVWGQCIGSMYGVSV